MALKWSKIVPTKPGIYLRKNPVASQVVRQDLYLIDGELCMSGAASLSARRLKNWGGAKIMWWFGPIPEAPKE